MPAKKKTEAAAAPEAEVKKTPAKKTAAKKTTKKAAEAAEATETKTTKKCAPKKTAEKKTAEKKTTEKKTAAKKPAAKKTVKKAEEEKAEVVKKSVQEYKDVINWKKWEAHNMDWLFIEVKAADLLQELEAGVDNMAACVEAVKDCMLEGDYFINPSESGELHVRYYTDNLNEWRRKYSEVN